MTAIVGITVFSVVMRRMVGSPLSYTEEFVGLLLSSALFLALPMVTVKAQHVRVTFLVHVLGARGRGVLAVLAATVTLGFFGWFLLVAWPWLRFAIEGRIKTEASSILLYPWMAVPLLSVALCALLVLTRLVTGSERRAMDAETAGS